MALGCTETHNTHRVDYIDRSPKAAVSIMVGRNLLKNIYNIESSNLFMRSITTLKIKHIVQDYDVA